MPPHIDFLKKLFKVSLNHRKTHNDIIRYAEIICLFGVPRLLNFPENFPPTCLFGAPRLLNFPKVSVNTFIPPTTFIQNTRFPRLLVLLQAFLLMIVDWKNTEWVRIKE